MVSLVIPGIFCFKRIQPLVCKQILYTPSTRKMLIFSHQILRVRLQVIMGDGGSGIFSPLTHYVMGSINSYPSLSFYAKVQVVGRIAATWCYSRFMRCIIFGTLAQACPINSQTMAGPVHVCL